MVSDGWTDKKSYIYRCVPNLKILKKINPFYLQRKGLFFLKNQKKTPFFADKGLAISNIVLKDKGDLITDNLKTNKFIQYLFYKYH